MAITYVDKASAASSSVSLPAFQVGDIALVLCYGTSAPSQPSGWNSIGPGLYTESGSGTNQYWRVGYRILQSGDTSTGTWTNASNILVAVYRGAHKIAPIAGFAGATYWNTGNAVAPAIPSGPATSVIFVGISNSGSISTFSPTNYTLRQSSGVIQSADSTTSVAGGTATCPTSYATIGLNIGLREPSDFPVIADGDTTSGTVTSNSSSWTLTYPTNIVAGDLLLALVAADGSAGVTSPDPNGWPSGWVSFYGLTSGANGLSIAKKSATGSETGTFSITLQASEQGSWVIYRIPAGTWEGTLGTVFDNSSSSGSVVTIYPNSTGADSNPNPPSLNPNNWDAGYTLWIAAMSADTSRTVSAYPSSPDTFTNTGSLVSGGSNGATLAWGRLEKNASSVDPGTFTISSSDDWVAHTIAIRGAPFKAFGQAQTTIGSAATTYRVYAQANTNVKATSTVFAQALTSIIGIQFAQAQTLIISIALNSGNAQAFIKFTGPKGTLDTFTRGDGSSGWGTSDSGAYWIGETYHTFGISSNRGYITPTGNTYSWTWLGGTASNTPYLTWEEINEQTSQAGLEYITFDINISSITFSSGYIIIGALITDGSTSASHHYFNGIILQSNGDKAFYLGTVGGSEDLYGTISFNYNTWYTIKTSLALSTDTELKGYAKIWERDVAEPIEFEICFLDFGSPIFEFNTGIPVFGGIYLEDSGITNSPTIYIDNFKIHRTWEHVAQALAQIISAATVVKEYAQAQADILAISTVFAQANTDIQTTYAVYAQANSDIKATYLGYAQANAQLITTNNAFAQANASIKTTYQTFGQSNTLTKVTDNRVYAQALADIKQTYPFGGQVTIAQDSFTESGTGLIDLNTHTAEVGGQWVKNSTALIRLNRSSDVIYGVNQGFYNLPISLYNGDIYIDIVGPDGGNPVLGARVIGTPTWGAGTFYELVTTIVFDGIQTPMMYLNRYTNDNVTQLASTEFSVTSDSTPRRIRFHVESYSPTILKGRIWKTSESEPSSWDIETSDNTAANQTANPEEVLLGEGSSDSAFALDNFLVTSGTPIEGPTFAQAQAKIKNTYTVYAQTQARIKTTYQSYAQAQSDIQATYQVFAQSNADILTTYLVYAQAQTSIVTTYQAFSQANASIKQTYQGYAQANALIKVTYQVFAQSLADIKQTYPLVVESIIAQDSFTEAGSGLSLLSAHTPEIGSWTDRSTTSNFYIYQSVDEVSHVGGDGSTYEPATVGIIADGYVKWRRGIIGAGASGAHLREVTSDLDTFYYIDIKDPPTLYRVTNGSATSLGTVGGSGNWFYFKVIGSSPTALKVECRTTQGALGTGWLLETTDNTAANQIVSGYAGIVGVSADQDFDSTSLDDFLAVELDIEGPTFAQAEAKILNTYQKFAQGNASITQTYLSYAQAQASILATYQVFSQALATLPAGLTREFAQASADILSTSQVFAQAFTRIKQTYPLFIYLAKDTFTESGTGTMSLDSHTAEIGGTWSTSSLLVDKDNDVVNPPASMLNAGYTFINGNDNSSGTYIVMHVWGLNNDNFNENINYTWIGPIVRKVSADTYYELVSAPSGYNGGSILRRSTNGVLTTLAWDLTDIFSTNPSYDSSYQKLYVANTNPTILQGKIWTPYVWIPVDDDGYWEVNPEPASWNFSVSDSTAANQIASGPFGMSFRELLTPYGNFNVNSFEAYIVQNPTYAQASADIFATSKKYAQAQAKIKSTYQVFAQAQTKTKVTNIQAFGQALANIKSTYLSYAQANAAIKVTYQVFAQSQSTIATTSYAYGQSLAWIYIPQYSRPSFDMSNEDWVRTVR